MKTDTELTTKPLPARIGGFALLPSLSPTSPASSPNPKNASSLGFSSSVGSAAPSTAGNRTREQIGLSVTQSSYNNLNQLTGQGAGGPLQFSGNLNKPGTVTVGGILATMDTGSTNFTGTASVTTGTNAVAVVATNVNGNAATNNYQVVVPAGSSTSPTYDANGNTTNNGTSQTYTWDAKNELVKITYTGGAASNFTYDGLNRRTKIIEKNSSGTVTSTKQYVWMGDSIAEERDASNNVMKRFFSQGEQQGASLYYYTSDHLGSTREMCSSTGSIVARYSYDPNGRTTLVSGSNIATFQYTGDYYHQTSALYLTKYRAFDPNTGRWLSRDPVAEKGGLNLYGYVGNDPEDNIDRKGLYTVTPGSNGSITVQLDNCEVVVITGHGAGFIVNHFIPPSVPGCGAAAGQDTCGNGPTNSSVPAMLSIPGIPTNKDDGRISTDSDKNNQTFNAEKAAVQKLCKCCKTVKLIDLYYNRNGWMKRTWDDYWNAEGQGARVRNIDCKGDVDKQMRAN